MPWPAPARTLPREWAEDAQRQSRAKVPDAPLPFRVFVLAAGIWTARVVLGAILATDAAATRAARLTVREALTYD
jgi:hypothetical protein